MFLYLMFPKGYQAVLYRFVYYIPSFFVILRKLGNGLSVWLICISTYLFIEGIVCPSRNLLNDLKDYKGDIKRGNRWSRYINEKNWNKVLVWVLIKWVMIFLVCLFFNIYLLMVVLGLLSVQLLYDHVFKQSYPMISVVCIASGYIFRALSMFFANHLVVLNVDVAFISFLSFLYAFYQVLEWRFYESKFIIKQNIEYKPGTEYFMAAFVPKLIQFVFGLFEVVLLTYFQYLMYFSIQWYLLIINIFFVSLFQLILSIAKLEELMKYMGSFYAIILFSIVTMDKGVIVVIITLFSPYFLSYHSRIYMRKKAFQILKSKLFVY